MGSEGHFKWTYTRVYCKSANLIGLIHIDHAALSADTQWAFCTNWSHGTKFAILDGKRMWHPPLGHQKQRKVKLGRLEFLCVWIWYILLPSSMADFVTSDDVTSWCKKPIRNLNNDDGNTIENVTWEYNVTSFVRLHHNPAELVQLLQKRRTTQEPTSGVRVKKENEKLTEMSSRSLQNLEFGHFTLLFCKWRQRNV